MKSFFNGLWHKGDNSVGNVGVQHDDFLRRKIRKQYENAYSINIRFEISEVTQALSPTLLLLCPPLLLQLWAPASSQLPRRTPRLKTGM